MTRADQISASVCPAYSKFFNSRSLSTVTPFAARWLPNLSCSGITPLNSLLSLTILQLIWLNALRAEAFVAKKHIKTIFNKMLNWTVYRLLISTVLIRTSINSNNHYFFLFMPVSSKTRCKFRQRVNADDAECLALLMPMYVAPE